MTMFSFNCIQLKTEDFLRFYRYNNNFIEIVVIVKLTIKK